MPRTNSITKYGRPGLRRARVQDLGNVRMVHQRQRLPLRLEPGNDALGVHAQLDDLERDPAANRLLLLGHINHAAAAFADLLQQFVAAYPVAGFLRGNRREPDGPARSRRNSRPAFQELPGVVACPKQFLDALAQSGLAGAGLVQISARSAAGNSSAALKTSISRSDG